MRPRFPIHPWIPFLIAGALSGCYAGVFANRAEGGGTEAALGEQHELNYPAQDTFVLTQDALRGQGVLFDVKPENSLVTLWRNADKPPTFWQSLVGVQPRYRYEIQVTPEGTSRSKIIVNVRTEDIPDDQLPDYKASKRLDLFDKIDQVAAVTPPPSTLPRSGGVNFALLPNEDLKALAARVTGNPDNWNQIAKDNGLSSPADTTPLQTIWVRNTLLKNASKPAQSPDTSHK